MRSSPSLEGALCGAREESDAYGGQLPFLPSFLFFLNNKHEHLIALENMEKNYTTG